MKIAIIGYGRMGQIIASIAPSMGHEVKQIISTAQDWGPDSLANCDVAIEFTEPGAAVANILRCLEARVPVVCGTTGWLDRLAEVRDAVALHQGALLYASNFSVGVHLFFALNRKLAEWMDAHPEYAVVLRETHHIHKKDAPSGTAITIAENILTGLSRKSHWVNHPGASPDALEIQSLREGEVPGTHEVFYTSATDTISVKHEAHSREGFARGAITAAAWLPGRKGIFGMEDLLGL